MRNRQYANPCRLLCLPLLVFLAIVGCTVKPAASNTFCPEPPPQNSAAAATAVRILAVNARWNCWNILAAQQAAASLPRANLVVVGPDRFLVGSELRELAKNEFAKGHGPDLLKTSVAQMEELSQSGYIIPLNDCRQHHAAFEQIRPELWPLVTTDGNIWGVPFDINVSQFFYNRVMLRQLGWSERDIDTLSERIAQQKFLQSDMIRTASEAISKGITAPGYGYWQTGSRSVEFMLDYAAYGGQMDERDESTLTISRQSLLQAYTFHWQLARNRLIPETKNGRQSNSWSTRLIQRDAIAAGRVLFWQAPIGNIVQLINDYPAIHGRFQDQYGLAMPPAGVSGPFSYVPGGVDVFVIGSPLGTGRQLQEESCALLAQMLTPEINAHHAATAYLASVIASSEKRPVYQAHPLLSQVSPMDNLLYISNFGLGPYSPLLAGRMDLVERGELTPEEAVEETITMLQTELGDRLVVEENR